MTTAFKKMNKKIDQLINCIIIAGVTLLITGLVFRLGMSILIGGVVILIGLFMGIIYYYDHPEWAK